MGTPLSILIDPAQDRLSVDALSSLVSGRDWSPTGWNDIWVDPITNTCMLRPAPQYPAWSTSDAGIFAKYGLSDFTLTDSANWTTHQPDTGGDFMYYNGSAGNTGGLQGYTADQLANQPMVVEYFGASVTNSPYGILDFGWGSSLDYTTGVSCRLYADGRIDVWQEGALVGTYSISGSSSNYFSSTFLQAQQQQGGVVSAAPRTGYTTLMVIPCRDRELLVVSNVGGGFCHIFENLPEGVAGQTITPAAPFWFFINAPVSVNLRIAKLQYASSGTVYGVQSNWRNTPSGSIDYDVYQSLSQVPGSWSGAPAADMVTPSVVTPATNPFSVPNPMQIKLDLVAGSPIANNWTPFVYGCRAFYPAQTEQTATPVGGPIQILPFTLEAKIDVSDTLGGTKCTLKLMQPEAMAAAGVIAIESMCQRAVQLSDEVGMFLNGVTAAPNYVDSVGFDSDSYDRNQDIDIEVRDAWKLAETYRFSDPIPLDGMTLFDAYVLVANMIGIPGDGSGGTGWLYVSPAAHSFYLPEAGSPSGGDWNVLIDVGDTGSEWLDRLHQTYAGDWFHGFRPNRATPTAPPLLSLIDPGDTTAHYSLPSTPSVTLYPTIQDAITIGAYDPAEAYKYVYRSLKWDFLEPEANDLYIMGMDFRTRKPIVVHKADTGSQNPTTAVASRPANWLGCIRKYGLVDPTITTIQVATSVMDLLFPKLTAKRQIVEFESEYVDGLWRGDLVELYGAGFETALRLKTFSGGFDFVGTFGDAETPDAVWRPCRYVGEVGTLVAPLNVHGTRVRAISQNWNTLRALSKQIVMKGGELILRRPVLNQQDL